MISSGSVSLSQSNNRTYQSAQKKRNSQQGITLDQSSSKKSKEESMKTTNFPVKFQASDSNSFLRSPAPRKTSINPTSGSKKMMDDSAKGIKEGLKLQDVKFGAAMSSPESVLKQTAEFGNGILNEYTNHQTDYGPGQKVDGKRPSVSLNRL